MNFNEHYHLAGKHAYLSASKYHWIRYSPEKLEEAYRIKSAAELGTRLHDFAAEAIRLKLKMPRTKQTLNMYVNDAIGFRMDAERVLYYSDNAFGTADAISFKNNLLRIHDLKTGISPTKMDQLMVYAAFFCLEYDFKPTEIQIELRIYQNDDVVVHVPDPVDIVFIMDRIKTFDKIIEDIKMEEL